MDKARFFILLHKVIKWLNEHHMPPRLIGAVAAGVVLSKVLSTLSHELLHLIGIMPPLGKPLFDPGKLVIALVFHSISAVFSAYVTAWLAGKRAKRAVFILGTKEAILWLLGILLLWKRSAPWFNLTKAILGVPLAELGGWLYRLHVRKKEGNNTPAVASDK